MIHLNNTNEALEFGKKASEQDVELLRRIRNACVIGFENLMAEDCEDFDLLAHVATQGQLAREAIEVSNYA